MAIGNPATVLGTCLRGSEYFWAARQSDAVGRRLRSSPSPAALVLRQAGSKR
jgi:hypothetical protein